MNDRLDFTIEGVRNSIDVMREDNAKNKELKEDFLGYIDSTLSVEWNTTGGQEAVTELKNFVNTQYNDYINYLDEKIDGLDNVVVPALERINNA